MLWSFHRTTGSLVAVAVAVVSPPEEGCNSMYHFERLVDLELALSKIWEESENVNWESRRSCGNRDTGMWKVVDNSKLEVVAIRTRCYYCCGWYGWNLETLNQSMSRREVPIYWILKIHYQSLMDALGKVELVAAAAVAAVIHRLSSFFQIRIWGLNISCR